MPQLLNLAAGAAAIACVGGVLATQFLDRPRALAQPKTAAASPAMRQAAAPPAPAPPVASARPPWESSGYGVVTLEQGPSGHYVADVVIRGRPVQMLVDTGATVIALTEEDARAIGVYPSHSDYSVPLSTANGVIKSAPVVLGEVSIGNISVRAVQAVVLPRGAMRGSLLGMSFLKKLRGFEIASGRLVLRQ